MELKSQIKIFTPHKKTKSKCLRCDPPKFVPPKTRGETLQHLGARGVLHEVRARIRWLEELRREL